MHFSVLCSPLPSFFAGRFQCGCCAPEQGMVAVTLAMCHPVLDNVARSKNKRWKNMQTEETRHSFTSWAEQLPSHFLAPSFFQGPLSFERWMLLYFYNSQLSTPTFNPWLPSRDYVVRLLLLVQVLWWNTALLFLPSILQLHISLLKRNRVIQAFRVIPSLTGEADERVVYWCLFDLIFLKYKYLVSSWVFTIPVFVIRKSFVTRI